MKPDLIITPYRSAIYGLRRGSEYLYIGQSTGFYARISHLTRFKPEPTDELDIWFCDRSNLLRFERALLGEYKPKFNKQVPRIKLGDKSFQARKKARLDEWVFAKWRESKTPKVEIGYVHQRRGSEPTHIFGEQSSSEVAAACHAAREDLKRG